MRVHDHPKSDVFHDTFVLLYKMCFLIFAVWFFLYFHRCLLGAVKSVQKLCM